jgi:hypothetical protein
LAMRRNSLLNSNNYTASLQATGLLANLKSSPSVIPAKAGIHRELFLDARLHGHDGFS